MYRQRKAIRLFPLLLTTGFLTLAAVGSLAQQQNGLLITPQVRAAMDTVRPQAIRAHVRFLADDLLEGRDTPSTGTEIAARYIASHFEQLGIKPAGDNGTYLQQVPFVSTRVDPAKTRITITAAGQQTDLAFQRDFIWNGPGTAACRAEAPLVFAGYGITAPEYQYDDYKDLDVRGKLVVLLSGEPASKNEAFFDGERDTRHAQSGSKVSLARSKGALGILWLATGQRARNFPWGPLGASQSRARISLGGARAAEGFPSLAVRDTHAEKLFAGAPMAWPAVAAAVENGGVKPFPLAAAARVEVAVESTPSPSPNVAGLLEGSDPELKKQVVVYTAHYDHVGRRDGEGDMIFNGAWDNASGTAGVMEAARAFAALNPAPKRSILFLLVTGEEKGLLGSRYYTQKPLIPIEQTAANINLDMTEIFGVPREIVPQGAERSTLMRSAEAVAREMGLKIGVDPTPELRVFTRSDQYSFARVGVPCIFLRWANEYEDLDTETAKARAKEKLDRIYHRPADNFDPTWSWDGMKRHTDMAFLFGLHVANEPEMPRWNAGDEFDKPRAPLPE
jgi:hypothetical protein